MKKAIAYIGAFINFKLGCLTAWLTMNDLWTNDYTAQLYLSFMEAAYEWQEWGSINYPWKDEER